MKKVLLFTIALVFVLSAPVNAANVNTVKETIVKKSMEMGVDPAIMLSIAKSESGFKQETRSPRGAVGVFQLMPSTARRMGLNPYSLDDNIKGGIMYYKSMYKMFGSVELALAAYNAGPGNVKKYHSVPPFRETKRYVARIMTDYRSYKTHPEYIANLKVSPSNANALKQQVTKNKVEESVVAKKNAPLPMVAIEQTRSQKSLILKDKLFEVDVKSKPAAI